MKHLPYSLFGLLVIGLSMTATSQAQPTKPEIPLQIQVQAPTEKVKEGLLQFEVILMNTSKAPFGISVLDRPQPFTIKIFNSQGQIVNREILQLPSSSRTLRMKDLLLAPNERKSFAVAYPSPDNPTYKRLPDDIYSYSAILPITAYIQDGKKVALASSVLLQSNEVEAAVGKSQKKVAPLPADQLPGEGTPGEGPLTQADADKLPLAPETPAQIPLQVRIGDPAPNFEVTDMNGKMRRLADYQGKSNLLLTFFPKCFTGGCANHLSSLRDVNKQLDAANFQVLAVSVDPAEGEKGQREFAKMWALQFPLIPDTKRELSILYGAAHSRDALASRMTFLIDKEGTVRFIDTNVNVKTHGADMLAKINALGIDK